MTSPRSNDRASEAPPSRTKPRRNLSATRPAAGVESLPAGIQALLGGRTRCASLARDRIRRHSLAWLVVAAAVLLLIAPGAASAWHMDGDGGSFSKAGSKLDPFAPKKKGSGGGYEIDLHIHLSNEDFAPHKDFAPVVLRFDVGGHAWTDEFATGLSRQQEKGSKEDPLRRLLRLAGEKEPEIWKPIGPDEGPGKASWKDRPRKQPEPGGGDGPAAAVPEPHAALLFGAGLVLAARTIRRSGHGRRSSPRTPTRAAAL